MSCVKLGQVTLGNFFLIFMINHSIFIENLFLKVYLFSWSGIFNRFVSESV